jgi:hypothetical protein
MDKKKFVDWSSDCDVLVLCFHRIEFYECDRQKYEDWRPCPEFGSNLIEKDFGGEHFADKCCDKAQ